MSLLNKLEEIYEGWKNDAFPTEEILALAKTRASICAECPFNIKNTCSTSVSGEAVTDFVYQEEFRQKGKIYKGCGCYLSKKTKSPKSNCPVGKWLAE